MMPYYLRNFAMKKRLDILIYESGLAPSREMARRYILAGEVRVNGQVADKPGMTVDAAAELQVQQAARFVSRGGEKLEGAFVAFNLNVEGKICADVGASTGGFTDCLLQHGAGKIYAIDVGYGELSLKLRNDARVVVIERTNARYLEKLDEQVSFVCIDASFIPLGLLLPVIKNWLLENGEVVALVKPQFEAGKKDIGKGGVVKDPAVHQRVLSEVLTAAIGMGYIVRGVTRSPITGQKKGNVEFLAWLSLSGEACDLDAAITAAVSGSDADSQAKHLSDLRGLGKEIWQGIDAQEYVNELRDEWDERS
jgi:23S rRNA (cytidine1920-2'-O)/16S rRNA (cytidine1409-2'-O)-methyltransferase